MLGVAIDVDGSVLYTVSSVAAQPWSATAVLRLRRDGVINPVVGGASGTCTDASGTAALSLVLCGATRIHVRRTDGALLIADGRLIRIARRAADGNFSTVTTWGHLPGGSFDGDGLDVDLVTGPVSAKFVSVVDVTSDAAGRVFFIDGGRIRTVGTDNVLRSLMTTQPSGVAPTAISADPRAGVSMVYVVGSSVCQIYRTSTLPANASWSTLSAGTPSCGQNYGYGQALVTSTSTYVNNVFSVDDVAVDEAGRVYTSTEGMNFYSPPELNNPAAGSTGGCAAYAEVKSGPVPLAPAAGSLLFANVTLRANVPMVTSASTGWPCTVGRIDGEEITLSCILNVGATTTITAATPWGSISVPVAIPVLATVGEPFTSWGRSLTILLSSPVAATVTSVTLRGPAPAQLTLSCGSIAVVNSSAVSCVVAMPPEALIDAVMDAIVGLGSAPAVTAPSAVRLLRGSIPIVKAPLQLDLGGGDIVVVALPDVVASITVVRGWIGTLPSPGCWLASTSTVACVVPATGAAIAWARVIVEVAAAVNMTSDGAAPTAALASPTAIAAGGWPAAAAAYLSYDVSAFFAPAFAAAQPQGLNLSATTDITIPGSSLDQLAPAVAAMTLSGALCSSLSQSASAWRCRLASQPAWSATSLSPLAAAVAAAPLSLLFRGTLTNLSTALPVGLPPVVQSALPTSIAPGVRLSVFGRHFAAGSNTSLMPVTIAVGGADCGSVTVLSPTALTCTLPADLPASLPGFPQLRVVVTSPFGSSAESVIVFAPMPASARMVGAGTDVWALPGLTLSPIALEVTGATQVACTLRIAGGSSAGTVLSGTLTNATTTLVGSSTIAFINVAVQGALCRDWINVTASCTDDRGATAAPASPLRVRIACLQATWNASAASAWASAPALQPGSMVPHATGAVTCHDGSAADSGSGAPVTLSTAAGVQVAAPLLACSASLLPFGSLSAFVDANGNVPSNASTYALSAAALASAATSSSGRPACDAAIAGSSSWMSSGLGLPVGTAAGVTLPLAAPSSVPLSCIATANLRLNTSYALVAVCKWSPSSEVVATAPLQARTVVGSAVWNSTQVQSLTSSCRDASGAVLSVQPCAALPPQIRTPALMLSPMPSADAWTCTQALLPASLALPLETRLAAVVRSPPTSSSSFTGVSGAAGTGALALATDSLELGGSYLLHAECVYSAGGGADVARAEPVPVTTASVSLAWQQQGELIVSARSRTTLSVSATTTAPPGSLLNLSCAWSTDVSASVSITDSFAGAASLVVPLARVVTVPLSLAATGLVNTSFSLRLACLAWDALHTVRAPALQARMAALTTRRLAPAMLPIAFIPSDPTSPSAALTGLSVILSEEASVQPVLDALCTLQPESRAEAAGVRFFGIASGGISVGVNPLTGSADFPPFGISSPLYLRTVTVLVVCSRPNGDTAQPLAVPLPAADVRATLTRPPSRKSESQQAIPSFSLTVSVAGVPPIAAAAIFGGASAVPPSMGCSVAVNSSVPPAALVAASALTGARPPPSNATVFLSGAAAPVDPLSGTAEFTGLMVTAPQGYPYALAVTCTIGSSVTIPIVPADAATWVLDVQGCPAGMQSAGVFCKACAGEQFSLGGMGQDCRSCPRSGAECVNGIIALLPDFYRSPGQAYAALGPQSQLLPCTSTTACVVNQSAPLHEMYSCAVGREGPLCSICQTGYYPLGTECAVCLEPLYNALLLSFLAVFIVAILAYTALKQGKKAKKLDEAGARASGKPPQLNDEVDTTVSLRILLSYLQAVGSLRVLRAGGTAAYRSLMGWTGVVSTSPLSVGAVECAWAPSFLGRYLTTLFLPFIMASVVALIFLLATTCRSCRRRPKPARGCHFDCGHCTSKVRAWSAERRHISVVVFVFMATYMAVFSASLRALDCYEHNIDGVTYLRADMRIVCGRGDQSVAHAFAIVGLIVLGVVAPLAMFLTLARVRADKLVEPATKAAFGFLFVGYRATPPAAPLRAVRTALTAPVVVTDSKGRQKVVPGGQQQQKQGRRQRGSFMGQLAAHATGNSCGDCVCDIRLPGPIAAVCSPKHMLWFEAAVLVRKAALAFIATLVPDAFAQIAAVTVLLGTSLALQLVLVPYEKPLHNTLEAVNLGASALTAIVCAVLLQYKLDDAAYMSQPSYAMTPSQWAVTVVLVIINFTAVGVLGGTWLWFQLRNTWNNLEGVRAFFGRVCCGHKPEAPATAGAGAAGGKGAATVPAGRVAAQVVSKSVSRGKTRLLTSAAPTALVEGKAGVDSSGWGDDAIGLRSAGADDVPRIIVSPLSPGGAGASAGAAASSGSASGIGMETSPAERAALAYARQRRGSGVNTGSTDGNGRSSFTPHAYVSSAANKRVGRARALAHAQAQARGAGDAGDAAGDAAEDDDEALPAASSGHLAPLPVTPRTPLNGGGGAAAAAAPPSGAELAHVMSSLQALMQQVQSIYSAVSPSQLGGSTPNPLLQTAPSVGSGLSASASASASATFGPSAARSTRILFADDK